MDRKNKKMPEKGTSNALEILDAEFGSDSEYQEILEEERNAAQVARAIREAREAAGLTQGQLAESINTRQSAVSRLEDASYTRHSLSTLRRIADALNQDLEVRFVPRNDNRSARKAS